MAMVLLAGSGLAFAAGLWVLGARDDLLALAFGALGASALAVLQRLLTAFEPGGHG